MHNSFKKFKLLILSVKAYCLSGHPSVVSLNPLHDRGFRPRKDPKNMVCTSDEPYNNAEFRACW